jgi:hypothetical protein
MELTEVASRIATFADDLGGQADRLRAVAPATRAFAADGPGALFQTGAALRAQWQAALAAREREASSHGARLTGLAGALRQAAQTYADAEDSSHRAHGRAVS